MAKNDARYGLQHLDDKNRCCGRKPLQYKRPKPCLFCTRCDREYDPITKQQRPNWAYNEHGVRVAP